MHLLKKCGRSNVLTFLLPRPVPYANENDKKKNKTHSNANSKFGGNSMYLPQKETKTNGIEI